MNPLFEILTPFPKIADDCRDMYFQGEKWTLHEDNSIVLDNGGVLHTATYFNGFSVRKWRKYTDIQDLFLNITASGKFRIDIKQHFRTEWTVAHKPLIQCFVDACEKKDLQFNLTEFLHYDGMLSFSVHAIEKDVVIYNACYSSTYVPQEINLALCMCTYKRESYVKKAIQNYEKLHDESIQLFVSDNASTLPSDNRPGVHIYQNPNYGGAGGFTRCMLEVKRYNLTASKPCSHLLLMDDDILLDTRILYRLKHLLERRKSEYSDYFVIGAMANLDYPYIQYERNSAFFGENAFKQFGAGVDLRGGAETATILDNDDVEHYFKQTTAGWWFCCMPIAILGNNNYPFPCFFRGDDLEFAFRNGSNAITMNGLLVWHEPFYKKYSNTSENYYLPRNIAVVNSLYRQSGLTDTIRYFKRLFKSCILHYEYDGAALLIRALNDFMKGPDFFSEVNPEMLNAELAVYNHKLIGFREALGEYSYDEVLYWIHHYNPDGTIGRIIRVFTLNGYLLPKFMFGDMRIAGIGYQAHTYSFFRKKRIFNAEPFSYRGYFTSIDKSCALHLTIRFLGEMWRMKKNYKQIQAKYSLGMTKLQSESFWVDYLGIDAIEENCTPSTL